MTLPTPGAAFRWTTEPWGIGLRCAALEDVAQHVFTSRQLRLTPQPPGDAGNRAWAIAAASVGGTSDRLMRVKQVHGAVVRVLPSGTVTADAATTRPDGDALVSDAPGLVLAVQVADCVPILMADAVSGATASVHAGWRGTCAGIAAVTVRRMVEAFGASPKHLVVAIGPSIGPADYVVGESLLDDFLRAGHARRDVDAWFARGDGALRLDLWRANADQLAAAGVRVDRIFTCGLSTASDAGVFDSYRRDGERAGRMAALIRVPGA